MKLSDFIHRRPVAVAFGMRRSGADAFSVERTEESVSLISGSTVTELPAASPSEAGVLTAADKSKLDRLESHGSAAELELVSVDASIAYVRAAGYGAPGDGGGGLYVRAASEPSHDLKRQSADGAWWELVPERGWFDIRQAGAVADDATSIKPAFDAILGYTAILAAQDNGALYPGVPGIIVPPGRWYSDETIELKVRVHILGQSSGRGGGPSQIRFPANTTGIIVHRYNTTGATVEDPPTTGGDGSIIEGLHLVGGGGTIAGITDDTKGHGVWLRSNAVIRDCRIDGFAGDGVHILATAGGSDATEGNANCWRLETVDAFKNGLNGVFVDGGDVNAGYAVGLNCMKNGRWGIWDSSFLGNTYDAPHAAENGVATLGLNTASQSSLVTYGGNRYAANVAASEADLVATEPGTDEGVWILVGSGGATSKIPTWTAAQDEGTYFHGGAYRTDGAVARNVFDGAYAEGGQGPSQLVTPTIMAGGMAAETARGTALVLDGDAVRTGELAFGARTGNPLDLELTLRPNNVPDTVWRAVAGGDHARGLAFGWSNSTKMYRFVHANSDLRQPLLFTSDLTTAQFGTGAAIGAGFPWMRNGLILGADGRKVTYGSAAPTTGAHARGEIVFNTAPSAGGNVGWVCTTAGTPGIWSDFGAIS